MVLEYLKIPRGGAPEALNNWTQIRPPDKETTSDSLRDYRSVLNKPNSFCVDSLPIYLFVLITCVP